MASDVVSSYNSQIVPALQQIPTISISTDLKNLFDSGTGIYVNAYQKGIEWERDCSVELINPNGDPGFQINAGLRIRGGCSYHGLSLNVDIDLTPFAAIDPCGYPDLKVTRLRDLGVEEPAHRVAQRLADHLLRQLSRP